MGIKRLLALLSATALLLALTACHVKKGDGKILSDDEIAASQEAEYSSIAAASSAVEASVAEEMDDVIKKDIGKTQKNKQVVVLRTEDYYTEYKIYKVDRKGMIDYVMSYTFYDEDHYTQIKNYGDQENNKLVKHDDGARLLVYKNSSVEGFSYDDIIKNYEDDPLWTIVK